MRQDPEKEAAAKEVLNLQECTDVIVQCSSPPCMLGELDNLFRDSGKDEVPDQPATKGARMVE
jgi:hypothetical protein